MSPFEVYSLQLTENVLSSPPSLQFQSSNGTCWRKMQRARTFQTLRLFRWGDFYNPTLCTHSLLFTSHRTAIIGLSKHLKALFLHWPSFCFSSSYLCPAGLIDGSRVQLFRVSALCQLNQRGEGTEVEQVSLWLDPVGKLLPRWGGFERTLRDNLQTLVSDKSPVWDGSESEHVSQRSCSCSPARPFWKQLHFSSPHCERTKIFILGCS